MKLTQIQTIDNVFLPGVGDLTKTINSGDSQKQAKFPGLVLEIFESAGVKVTVMGRFAIVPWGNIKAALGTESPRRPASPTARAYQD